MKKIMLIGGGLAGYPVLKILEKTLGKEALLLIEPRDYLESPIAVLRGLMDPDGTERPALTWLVDFVKKHPDPPNDYPGLLPPVSPGTNARTFFVAPTPLHFESRGSRDMVKVVDLRGRSAEGLSINGQLHTISSMAPSSGSYVIKLNGRHGTVVNTIR